MHILHVSNAFPNSSLYKQLTIHLDELKIKQTIYSAVRTKQEAQFNPPELAHLDMGIRNILQPHDRLFYRNKIKKIKKDVADIVNFKNIDLIHAHTLYSDGGVALKLKEKYKIPYVVAVRSTDLNIFQKYRPDLRWRRNKILQEAEKVIFISPAHRYKFLKLLNSTADSILDKKSITIPNGLDPLFLEQSFVKKREDNDLLKLLYVGTFIKRKNVPKTIEAAHILSESKNIIFTLVGGGGEEHEKVAEMINSDRYPFIEYRGKIKDGKKLRKIYASHDIFVMASYNETFGLVYIEAMSQGLPIVYTKGEGVDGYFEKGRIGEAIADTQNPDEIASKIKNLAARLNPKLRQKCVAEAQQFNWNKISEAYHNIYTTALH